MPYFLAFEELNNCWETEQTNIIISIKWCGKYHKNVRERLVNCLIGWLDDWLIAWFFIDWLINWLIIMNHILGVVGMTLFSWILLAPSFLLSFGLPAAMEEIKNLFKKFRWCSHFSLPNSQIMTFKRQLLIEDRNKDQLYVYSYWYMQ